MGKPTQVWMSQLAWATESGEEAYITDACRVGLAAAQWRERYAEQDVEHPEVKILLESLRALCDAILRGEGPEHSSSNSTEGE